MTSPTIDTSLLTLIGLLSGVIGIALYVWMALALSALFRKIGEESWKGWVPFLNQATVLKWGGFSPWLILLLLVPGLGALAVLVLTILSAHRINPGFGYGTGMTVLAAFLFVVWASILGFGPAAWRGARPATSAPPVLPPSGGMGGSSPMPVPPRPPLPGTTGPSSAFAAPQGEGSPFGAVPPVPPAPAASGGSPQDGGALPAPAPGLPDAWGPPGRAGSEGRSAENDAWSAEIDDVSAVSPSPYPPSSASSAPRPFSPPPPAAPPSDVGGSAPSGHGAGSSDVVDGLISFVPGARAAAQPEPAADPGAQPPVSPTGQPVPVPPATVQPPAVRPSATGPLPTTPGAVERDDHDVFPEMSGEVSAVVGSPVAGAPLSARSSVSAQHRGPDPEDVDADDVDQTVMVRRKTVAWRLVPAAGDPIALTAETVVLGRRPAADPAFPLAQLVAVPDQARTVSKTHARLELRGDRWAITDLGSTNGVLVRTLMGEELEVAPGTELEAGERFYLGDEEFHLQHE